MDVLGKEKLKLFIGAEEIRALNCRLGQEISRDYATRLGPGEALLLVTTLKGALLFPADLIREITVLMKTDFVCCASYGAGTKSSGTVKLLKDLDISPKGAHILILDEIVDTGRTVSFLLDHFAKAEAKSVKVCTLLDKKSRREVEVEVDYIGKEVEDKFLVGYGLDFNETYRNLPDIYYV